eukprot:PhF_6_TR982/c0_g1_i2/m.1907/K09571/FKBP4_5; FK506-binding protein 4/5
MIDVPGTNGHIRKQLVNEGSGQTLVPHNARVRFTLTVSVPPSSENEESVIIDPSHEGSLTIHYHRSTALAKALRTMKKGEISVFLVDPIPAISSYEHIVQFHLYVLGWTLLDDISEAKDGGIMKETLQPGDSSCMFTPDYESKVAILLRDLKKSDSDRKEISFEIGDGTVSDPIEKAVQTMKVNEVCHVRIREERAGEESNEQQTVSVSKEEEEYQIQLVSHERVLVLGVKDPQQRLDEATRRKDNGNTLMQSGQHTRALKKYLRGLEFLADDRGWDGSQLASRRTLQAMLCNNIALIHFKRGEWKDVNVYCNKSLQ